MSRAKKEGQPAKGAGRQTRSAASRGGQGGARQPRSGSAPPAEAAAVESAAPADPTAESARPAQAPKAESARPADTPPSASPPAFEASPTDSPPPGPSTHGPVAPPTRGPGGLDFVLDVPLRLTVEIGSAQMRVAELLQVDKGSVIELDRLAGEPADLLVNGRIVARGEVTLMDERLSVRVLEIDGRSLRAREG